MGKLDGDTVRVGDLLDDNEAWLYRVVEIKPRFLGDDRTGFRLQKTNRWGDDGIPFWVTQVELESIYTLYGR